MNLLRLITLPVRLVWPHLLAPWRAPLLRWRIETYGAASPDGRLLHAEELTLRDILRFTGRHRQALARFLFWAARL